VTRLLDNAHCHTADRTSFINKLNVVFRTRVAFCSAKIDPSGAPLVNSALKDNYGARFVRVRGHDKVLCHLMFGILALAVEQLMRLVT
jgi:hypothetical protein